MNFRLFYFIVVVLLVGGLTLTAPHATLASGDSIQALTKTLSEQILESSDKRPRVTVLDFTDIRNRPNELGRYLALKLAFEMVTLREVSVLDRANLETIMAEHELTAAGLLRPEDARKLGQFAGVDAILIGNISVLGDSVELIVRAISTETSEIIASGSANLEATSDFRRMLGMQVDGGTTPGVVQGSTLSSAMAREGDVIALRELGPLEAVLRNVRSYSIQSNGDRHQRIRCTFDLNNRSLEHSIVVAANQRIQEGEYSLVVQGFRGDLIDSRGTRWIAREVRGIPGVAGFETPNKSRSLSQNNPGGVVRYIQTATRYKAGGFPRESKKFWAGSFTEIQPGDSLRMTIEFEPVSQVDEQDSGPTHFQLDMELVVGTIMEEEAPEEASDLTLRNLTIDQVMLPTETE